MIKKNYMSEIKYGLISATDWRTISKTLDLAMAKLGGNINTFEIGINEGHTSRAIKGYIESKGWKTVHYAVDNQQDLEMKAPFPECNFFVGDSVSMSYYLSDDVFQFGFIDANHSFHKVIADFVAYAPKIVKGGFLLFHDTKPNIPKFRDYQKVGSEKDERMYISVRPALEAIGLYDGAFPEWEVLFDEHDPENLMGGVTVFKKLY